jgi:hypothetical protein
MLESYARCPRCGRNDRAEKVTAIRTSQTQQINEAEQRVEVYVDRSGRRQTRTVAVPRTRTQMSDLAKRLEPPRKPSPATEPRGGASSAVLVIGIVLALLGLILAVIGVCPMLGIFGATSAEEAIITGLGTGVVCILPPIVLAGIGILLIVVGTKRRKLSKERHQVAVSEARNNSEQAERIWQKAMERWNELYYCHRDDCVFIPDEGSCAPLSKMHDYLYQHHDQ